MDKSTFDECRRISWTGFKYLMRVISKGATTKQSSKLRKHVFDLIRCRDELGELKTSLKKLIAYLEKDVELRKLSRPSELIEEARFLLTLLEAPQSA